MSKTTPILDGAYEVVGILPGLVGTPIGEVDLNTIPAETAEKLIALKFPYLKKAAPKAKKAKAPLEDTGEEIQEAIQE